MPLKRISKVYAVQDAQIALLLTDETGTAPTYGPDIDVPGVTEVTVSGDVNSVVLRGDNTKLDEEVTLTNVSVAVSHSLLSLDALACMLGMTIADSGTTPAQKVTADLTTLSRFNYFQLRAKSASALDGKGDVRVIFGKLKLSEFPEGIGFAEEDYQKASWTAGATPTAFDKRWFRLELNETALVTA